MVYDGQLTYTDLANRVRNVGNGLNVSLDQAKETFEDLRVFKDGRTNAQIATFLGVDVAWVDDLETCVTSLRDIARLADGTVVTNKNFRDDWRKFTP